MYIMEVNIRPSLRKKYGTLPQKQYRTLREEEAATARDKYIIKEMWCLVGMGLGIFLGGFGLWQLDNIYCSRLRRWRHEIGLPWGILLEGHGWCKQYSAHTLSIPVLTYLGHLMTELDPTFTSYGASG